MTRHSPYPDLAEPAVASRLLADAGWLATGEQLQHAAPAGDGNMNLTLRLTTDRGRTVVAKQARPWVEKYPDIAAPVERLAVEAAFYRLVAGTPAVAAAMPTLLHHAPALNAALFEDLGDGADCTGLYAGAQLPEPALRSLGAWLAALHSLPLAPAATPALANHAMRALNHAHIFVIPLAADNGVELPPEVAPVAAQLRQDPSVAALLNSLGQRYLADGPVLLHGDFYPGSWLQLADGGVAVLDPEFGFFGDPAFDLGVALGHAHLAGQPAIADTLLTAYQEAGGTADPALAWQFAATEVIRRILGVAQLPLAEGCDRSALLHAARGWLDGTTP